MDGFEAIVKTLLEAENYWVANSVKVELGKAVKKSLDIISHPRVELDLVAYKPETNELLLMEVKSYLDSNGVSLTDLQMRYQKPEGRYKLFTCSRYQDAVIKKLEADFKERGLIHRHTKLKILLGLAAGNIYLPKGNESDFKNYFESNGWIFWSPRTIKEKVSALINKGYTNDPLVMTAKLLLKDIPLPKSSSSTLSIDVNN